MTGPDTPRTPLRYLDRYRFSANQQIPMSSSTGLPEPAGALVAIKSIPRIGDSGVREECFKREIRILTKLARLPRPSIARFCELIDHFVEADRFCAVFDKLSGDNLHVVLRNPRLSAFPLHQTREISRQLLQATRFLHDNGIIHTDLRPENIVFVNKETVTLEFYAMDNTFHTRTVLRSTEIRIVDFGSVHEQSAHCNGLVGLVGFRAPEILMGWSWTETIDHFAIGCIVAELLTSRPLFPPFSASRSEDIAIMDKVLGPFSDDMVAEIQKDIPTAFDHRSRPEHRLSYLMDKYMETAKTISVRSPFPSFSNTHKQSRNESRIEKEQSWFLD
ncbi:kinase-like domain-containing protein [Mycena galericulata]|nr:kinase-like domain-containing protein [Mycena galericulata]